MLEPQVAHEALEGPSGVEVRCAPGSETAKSVMSTPITIDDLQVLLNPGKSVAEADVASYVQTHAKFVMSLRLKKLNACLDDLYEVWPEATPLELYTAFEMYSCDRDEAIYKLSKPETREAVREALDEKLGKKKTTPVVSNTQQDVESEADVDEDDEFIDEGGNEVPYSTSVRKKKKAKPVVIPPAPPGIDSEMWNSWSEAKRNSYKMISESPNAYYYRHLPPGEKAKGRVWTEEEKKDFIKKILAFRGDSETVDGDWGIFSLQIPGRVGYQCSNYYRKLVKSGEIKDKNYLMDRDGNLFHISRANRDANGNIIPHHYHKGKNRETTSSEEEPHIETRRGKPIHHREVTSLKLVSSKIPVNKASTCIGRYEEWALENPLKDAVDAITKEVIRVPAISPDGYVLDYNTWLHVLKSAHENPFTRVPLTKRQLVVLTNDNYDEYRDKIINLSD